MTRVGEGRETVWSGALQGVWRVVLEHRQSRPQVGAGRVHRWKQEAGWVCGRRRGPQAGVSVEIGGGGSPPVAAAPWGEDGRRGAGDRAIHLLSRFFPK